MRDVVRIAVSCLVVSTVGGLPLDARASFEHNRGVTAAHALAPVDAPLSRTLELGSSPEETVLRRSAGAPGVVTPEAPRSLELRESAPALGATPYKVNLLVDGVLTLGSFAAFGALEFGYKPTLSGGLHCVIPAGGARCSTAGLNDLDRSVVGNRSHPWALTSDITLGVTLGGAILGTMLDVFLSDSQDKASDLLADTVVLAESVGMAILAAEILKLTVRRPRPSQFDPNVPIGGPDDSLSFPSGHTATVASAAFALTTNFWLRHPESPWRFVMGFGALAATSLTGYARVGAGRHFYTDVLAGGLLGAASGILVPLVHHWLKDDDDSGWKASAIPSVGAVGDTGGYGLQWRLQF